MKLGRSGSLGARLPRCWLFGPDRRAVIGQPPAHLTFIPSTKRAGSVEAGRLKSTSGDADELRHE